MNSRTFVLKCPLDLCSAQDALERARLAIEEKKNFHVVTLNPEMIMFAQKNQDFFNILNHSELNIVDGVGVKLALKLQKINQQQIRGVDFSRSLINLANENNYRIAFLGAKEEVISLMSEKLIEKYPKLNIVYKRNGYFSDDKEIINEISEANPQILLVGLGSPRQEEIITKLKEVLKGCVMVGVGGSFDVFSGKVVEAPMLYRKLNLEWLYRTMCQPERFKRIFPTLPNFLIKCIIEIIKK